MIDSSDKEAVYEAIPPMKSLFSTSQQAILSNAELVDMQFGDQLNRIGDYSRCFYVVESGAVLMESFNGRGLKKAGPFFYAGDLLWMSTGDLGKHEKAGQCMCDGRLIKINRKIVGQLMSDVSFQGYVFRKTLEQSEKMSEFVERRLNACTPESLYEFLVEFSLRTDSKPVQLSHEEIACAMGYSRMTIHKSLKRLSEAGILSTTQRRREIHIHDYDSYFESASICESV